MTHYGLVRVPDFFLTVINDFLECVLVAWQPHSHTKTPGSYCAQEIEIVKNIKA